MNLNDVREYVLDEIFEIKYFKQKVNVLNYEKIVNIDRNKIIILSKDEYINIIGSNLNVIKMLKDELLITGDIKKIEMEKRNV